ncbi:hypothetical protein B0T26DRAFT_748236 [Lasiosphaeria miniovina]|uniref:HNH nuclease domain-containing protein n=1 Tax=Lasiosphaeria miniovina TaxID=1954250 RepID=A0AA40EA49_9PEZI|nr:uncharacterized protein B0T26DRAFT_748236 [Lasiosphaeria miniovina]KAK0727953.1 hypothetical protein B0T26DRAFT_748236 [Lasiosphaeria miniovina]
MPAKPPLIRVEYVGTKSLERVPVLPSSPGSAEPSHAAASAPAPTPDLPDSTPAPTPDLPDSQRSGSLADSLESQSSLQESQLPETDEELKQQFVQYVRDQNSSFRSEYAPTSAAKEAKLDMFSIGAMKIYMEKKGSSAFIAYLKFAAGDKANNLKRKRSDTSRHTTPTAKVPKWYGRSCILSGSTPVDGAYIVDVRASGMNAFHFWETLSMFWPLKSTDKLDIKGQEHPIDPEHRIYLQVVWLKDLDKFNGLIKGAWDHRGSGSIVDFRRGSDDGRMFPRLEHGDVYELSTPDPVRCPLPSIQFLQIRYAVQKIIAGIMAAGALKDIFGGEPSEDGLGPARHEELLPGDWEVLLEEAVEAEALTRDAAER